MAALRIKGGTVEEITAAARVLRSRAKRIRVENNLVNLDRDEINVEEETILDTCGTGGDGTNTFNISTATALVAAAGGVRVAKHGHRAVSSRCGSADVLSNLGVRLDINHANVERCIREIGLYVTQYILEVVLNDPSVIEVYGTDLDIYKKVNNVITQINQSIERAEEEINRQLSHSKSLVPGSRDYEIALDELFRKKLGDPQQV
jgi:hypothetical protein